MFASAKLQAIICTSKIRHAEQFYGGVLGLPLQARHRVLWSTMSADVCTSFRRPVTRPPSIRSWASLFQT